MEQRRYSWIPVSLAAVIIAVIAILSLYAGYRSNCTSNRRVALVRCQTVLDALAAGIRAQGRMGRYQVDRLDAILTELVNTPDVIAVALATRDGNVVASGGLFAPAAVTEGVPVWTGTQLSMSRTFAVHVGPGRGADRRHDFRFGESADDFFPRGEFVLTAVLDTTSVEQRIAADRTQFLISALLVLVVVVLGAASVLNRTRHRSLEAALMVERERIRDLERLAQVGAGLAHETKNPLGVVRGLAQSIAQSPDAGSEAKRLAGTIIDEADRTVRQINAFLDLARPKAPAPEAVPLDELVNGVAALVRPEAEGAGIALDCHVPPIRIEADPELLRRALLNLVINALHATPSGGSVQIEVAATNGRASLAVQDTGCGIEVDDLARVTEPYFGRFEGGTGLGLAIVDQVVRAHGWTLDIVSEPGRGTRVSLGGLSTLE